jgi:hypothetical protein
VPLLTTEVVDAVAARDADPMLNKASPPAITTHRSYFMTAPSLELNFQQG